MKLQSIITAAAIIAATVTPAHAARATLVSCEQGESVSGRLGFVGTYEVYGPQGAVQFTRFFPTYCPFSIEVY
jgi:hypothetical protein